MIDEKVDQGIQIVEAATEEGVTARLLGGIAVAVRCPSARTSSLMRTYSDFDLATTHGSGRRLEAVLAPLGFEPAARFNAINGRTRLLFTHDQEDLHVDVFVESFRMCHSLTFGKRLALDELTLPLAELLLTKAQVAELTAKDVQDICALLLDHDLTEDDTGINADYIAGILSRDWGFWRTVSENLGRVRAQLDALVTGTEERQQVAAALDELTDIIEARPTSMKWKARARLGDRVPWRQEPEEARR